jgi:hypothetical protein
VSMDSKYSPTIVDVGFKGGSNIHLRCQSKEDALALLDRIQEALNSPLTRFIEI